MTTTKLPREDRIFVRDGRRHHRRRYSSTELKLGLAVLGSLAAVLLWVAWRGAHPDPELFAVDVDLLETGVAFVERGPLPEGLAAPDWREGAVAEFDGSNLYEKINGREGFYKEFGFQRLYFVSMALDADPTTVVDIELYDLAEAPNALGAYSAEKSADIEPEIVSDGMAHFDRNAMYQTRGRHYIRAIGSDETPAVREQLERLKAVFERDLEGESLPWAYALFGARLGIPFGRISFTAENAFSFGFARNVYSALLEDDETEIYVVASETASEAEDLAAQYTEGFLGYGKAVGESFGVRWVEDRFLRSRAGARAVGAWLIGVRGAPDAEAAEAAVQRLEAAVSDLSREDDIG